MLRKEFPDDFGFSVSHTTREPRAGERDGVDYNFVPKPQMEAEVAAGRFLESANVHGNLYGTSYAAVDRVAAANRVCILDIDIQVRARRQRRGRHGCPRLPIAGSRGRRHARGAGLFIVNTALTA